MQFYFHKTALGSSAAVYSLLLGRKERKGNGPIGPQVLPDVWDRSDSLPYLELFSLSTWDGVVSVCDVLFISSKRLTCQFENKIYRKSLRKCELMFKMVQHHFSDHGDKLLMALILQDTVQFRVFTIVCILWDKRLYNMDMYLASVGRGKLF